MQQTKDRGQRGHGGYGMGKRISSLQFRLNFIIFITVFVMAAFLVINNLYATSVVRDNAYEANGSMLKLHMSQMDDSLKMVENYWVGLENGGDIPILNIASGIKYYTASVRLKTDMANVVQTYGYMDDLFVYVRRTGDFFDESKYDMLSAERSAIAQMIRSSFGEDGACTLELSKWQWIRSGSGEYYLVRMLKYGDVYLGGCINQDRLLKKLREAGLENGDYLTFCGSSGEIGDVLPDMEEEPVHTEEPQRYSRPVAGSDHLVITCPSECGDYSILMLLREQSILEGLGTMQKIIFVLVGLLVVYLFVFVTAIRRWILWPIRRLYDAMNRLKGGDLEVRLRKKESCREFILVNETFDEMIESIETLKIHVYEENAQRQRAQLQYLKLQVNPHFYINCMNVINNLSIMGRNDLVQEMTTYLGNHLRYTLEGSTLDHLYKEVAYVKNYARIQELRFADSFYAHIEVEPSVGEVLVPPLILQTFVENTVKYQVVPGEHTDIYIVAARCEPPREGWIRIEIWDTGDGFPDQVLACLAQEKQVIDERGEHYGINNVAMRLRLIYGGQEHIEFRNHWETGGAYIMMEIPDVGKTEEGPEAGERRKEAVQ